MAGEEGGGGLPRGELPFVPQLALKSFPHPEEGGKGNCEAPCSRELVRHQAVGCGWLL